MSYGTPLNLFRAKKPGSGARLWTASGASSFSMLRRSASVGGTEVDDGSSEGEVPGAEIILFLKDGGLSSMEYVWYTDKPPDRCPRSDRLTTLEIER